MSALVECEFKHLTISIDGATQETYAEFRRGGDFNRVIENIRQLNRLKVAHDAKYPELRWQFIAFGHNEHEIYKARRMARELGMIFYVKLNATAAYSPVRNSKLVSDASATGASSRAEYRQLNGRPYALPCSQLTEGPQINWNGDVLGCCRNNTVSLGDAFATPLSDCQTAEIYLKTMRVADGSDEDPSGTPCAHCSIYRFEILPGIQESGSRRAKSKNA